MVDLMKKVMLAGLGMESKIREAVEDLVRRGEESQGAGAKRAKDCFGSLDKDLKRLEEKERAFVKKVMAKLPIATKADLERLEEKIQALAGKGKKG